MADERAAMTVASMAVVSADWWAGTMGQKRVVVSAVLKAARSAVMSVIAKAGLKVVLRAVWSADQWAACWVGLLVAGRAVYWAELSVAGKAAKMVAL